MTNEFFNCFLKSNGLLSLTETDDAKDFVNEVFFKN